MIIIAIRVLPSEYSLACAEFRSCAKAPAAAAPITTAASARIAASITLRKFFTSTLSSGYRDSAISRELYESVLTIAALSPQRSESRVCQMPDIVERNHAWTVLPQIEFRIRRVEPASQPHHVMRGHFKGRADRNPDRRS